MYESRKTGNSYFQMSDSVFTCIVLNNLFHNITRKSTRFVQADKFSTVLEWTKGINNNKTSVGLALDCKEKKKKRIHTPIPLRPAAGIWSKIKESSGLL